MLCLDVKQPWQFDKNNAKTALRLLLHVHKTKLRHLTIKLFHSSDKTYLLRTIFYARYILPPKMRRHG